MITNNIYIYNICKNWRRTLVAIIATLSILEGWTQDFRQHWITTPYANSTSQIWYRKQIVTKKKIKKAFVSIATFGYADLYVNGRNVSRNIMNPYREVADTSAISTTYDITPYVNSDTLTIGVWYSPLPSYKHNEQISATIYGRYSDDETFAYASDGTWLCRTSSTSININQGENIDGNINPFIWKSHSNYSLALWQCVKEVKTNITTPPKPTPYKAYAINEIINYNYFDANGDTIYYDFGKGFFGLLRLTFRNARRGEKIYIGNNIYTASGALDEQTVIRFTPKFMRKVMIYGDSKFRISHITNIEALNISTTNTKYW